LKPFRIAGSLTNNAAILRDIPNTHYVNGVKEKKEKMKPIQFNKHLSINNKSRTEVGFYLLCHAESVTNFQKNSAFSF